MLTTIIQSCNYTTLENFLEYTNSSIEFFYFEFNKIEKQRCQNLVFKEIELKLVNSSEFFHRIFLLNISIILMGLSLQKTFKTQHYVWPICFATISASSAPSQQSGSSTTSTPRGRPSFQAPNHTKFSSDTDALQRENQREMRFLTQVVCDKSKNSLWAKFAPCINPQTQNESNTAR